MATLKKAAEDFEPANVAAAMVVRGCSGVSEESMLGNLISSMGAFFNTELTLDEEKTAAAILEMWSREGNSGAYQLAGEIAALSDDLNEMDFSTWSSSVGMLLDHLYKTEGGDIFVAWAAGLQVRASCVSDSLSAAKEREMTARMQSFEAQIAKLSSQLAVIEAKSDKLESQKEALEESVEAQQRALKATQALIEEATSPTISGEDQEVIIGVLKCQDSSTILIGDKIPVRKVVNARKACQAPNSDLILGLIDLTFFGSAKNAIVFGTGAFYFLEDEAPVHVPYSELRHYKLSLSEDGLKLSRKGQKLIIDCSEATALLVKNVLEQIGTDLA